MFPGRRYLAQVNRGMSVTSERQIAANRRNACESGGPRSWAGKQRARRNAYRHGLSTSIGTSPESAKQLDNLARKIALETATALKRARAVAEAELDLARVRRAKVSLIERVWTFGDLDSASPFSSPAQAIRLLKALERDRVARSEPIDCSASTPPAEPDRLAEAIRRVLPELVKLERYERRAAARRDRAVQVLGRRESSFK
jgi:hypothetical protein